MTHGTTPPGWYDDGQGHQRWWDGSQWTDHTQPVGGPPDPGTPPAVDLHSEVTRIGPATPGPGVGLDKGSSQPPPDQPAYGAPQGGYPQGGYPQPGYPQAGSPQAGYPQQGAYGAPGQPAWQHQVPPTRSGGRGKLFAIIGGVAFALVVGIVLLVVLLGGSGPDDVAQDYLEAQASGEYERACELRVADDIEELLESSEAADCGELEDFYKTQEEENGFADLVEDVETDIEIGDVEENDDTATVEFTIRQEYTGDDEERYRQYYGTDLTSEDDGTIDLVKEDGDWKVASADGQ